MSRIDNWASLPGEAITRARQAQGRYASKPEVASTLAYRREAGRGTASCLTEMQNDKTARGFTDTSQFLMRNGRQAIATVIAALDLPTPLDDNLVKALQDVLSGLVKISVSTQDIRNALRSNDGPANPAGLKRRFNEYIDSLTRGREPAKVRIVMEG